MQSTRLPSVPARKDGRIIIHFDYDCFYASVVEHENPALKHCPLAIQQKQIIVTCNYEARRHGLHKLQLITEAKKLCPDVVIVLGEDISRFRDASKLLYRYLKQFSWNGKVERLGFDEVWLDVTDIVAYNLDLLNRHALQSSFFQIVKDDPTQGFEFDATAFAGYSYPEEQTSAAADHGNEELEMRLRLGSHLAMYIRHRLEDEKGYTATAGISTSKLLSKLVGNLHKPNGQTTMVPPYESIGGTDSNVTTFIDGHEIGKIPGIGFKLAQKLRAKALDRPADFDKGLVYGGTLEKVTVRDVRLHPDSSPESLEKLLGGPGSVHGIGLKVWQLLHGVDDTEVSWARLVPRQISIEDSYIRLDTLAEVIAELTNLGRSLLTRMRIDLLTDTDEDDATGVPDVSPDGQSTSPEEEKKQQQPQPQRNITSKKWLAHPRTIRLSTRPRSPLNPDGTRTRNFKRISHSAPLPTFVFNLSSSIDALADKLVLEALIPAFRRLHPEKAGWNLSLVNVAVTNMAETASDSSRTASGRDIGNMFKRQELVSSEFRIREDRSLSPPLGRESENNDRAEAPSSDERGGHELDDGHSGDMIADFNENGDEDDDARWHGEDEEIGQRCEVCGQHVPPFALAAHLRFHSLGD
ncbi:hypothetical protein AAFC00_002122 [Neodothiora populina]|uniref:UmuC domain-containing protein n=1 Tax=Neodothiora populina TaxID=2781224 RepID=A0ABR3PGB9_9PEZI